MNTGKQTIEWLCNVLIHVNDNANQAFIGRSTMFWNRKKRTEKNEISTSVKEVYRRAQKMLRGQLELLCAEGAISKAHLDAQVKYNSEVDDGPIELENRSPKPRMEEPVTYLEACTGLLQLVGHRLIDPDHLRAIHGNVSGPDNYSKYLDPLSSGWFGVGDIDALLVDLVIGITLVRNQSLYHIFSEKDANEIEVQCRCCIYELWTNEGDSIYEAFTKAWMKGKESPRMPPPHLKIAQVIMQRAARRAKLPYEENPLQEICLGETLVKTCLYFWLELKEGDELQQG